MAVWAIWLLIIIGLPTLFVFVLLKLITGVKVSLANGTDAFNNVAIKVETLVGLGRIDETTAQTILESVINSLTVELGWDTVDESIREFQSTPFIVQAFENCGYKLEVVE